MSKGEFNIATDQYQFFLVIPAIFVSLIIVTMLIAPYSKPETSDMDHFVIRKNLLYSAECLAFSDNRVYPGIVDVSKLDENRIQKCLGINGNTYGVILKLNFDDVNKEIFVNKQMTDRINFCLSDGSFKCSDENVYVLVKEESDLKTGILNIKIVGFEK